MARNDLMAEVFKRMLHDIDSRMAVLADALRPQVEARVREFPDELLTSVDGAELVPAWRLLRLGLQLFPLGDYRRIWLPPQTGFTTLYIGTDRRLYEFGPLRLRVDDEVVATRSNRMALRPVNLAKIDFVDLLTCRELLDRVWLA